MTDQISHTPTPPSLPPPAPKEHERDTKLPELKPKRHAWVWILVLLAFALVFWWVLHRGKETSSSTTGGSGRGAFGGPVTATVVSASKGQIGVYLNAIGTVTPVYTATIVSQVTGQVVAVHFREGQLVKKDDALVDIDPRPFEATLKVA